MRPVLARLVPAFLGKRGRPGQGARAFWLLALAYLVAFLVVGFYLPVQLGTLLPAAGNPNPLAGAGLDGLGELATGWGFTRIMATALVILAALLLILPVAWVYTITKPGQYDPSLVQSLVILPVVGAGIVTVVKDSLALAFSLAGIVAAVRFRNTLEDPKDAVYIFLALGVGIAAGVGALDVALVLSASFNLVVVFLWRFNICNIYEGCYVPKPKKRRTVETRSSMPAQPPALPVNVAWPPATDAVTVRRKERDTGAVSARTLMIRVKKSELALAKHAIEQLLEERRTGWAVTSVPQENGDEVMLQYSVERPGGKKRKRLLQKVTKVGAPHIIEARYVKHNGKELRT